MATLLIAEHDNSELHEATTKALTAAKEMGGGIHVLVAGKGSGAVVGRLQAGRCLQGAALR